jgi:TonB family protein
MIVVFLAIIFFALLAVLLSFRRSDDRSPSIRDESLFVVPIRVRIRTQPTAKAPVLGFATRGQKLRLLDDQGSWVRVETEAGVIGWAERSALEGSLEHERRQTRLAAIRKLPPLDGVLLQSTPLYSGPGIFYPLVGEAKSGQKVRVFTRENDFYAIDFDGDIAYAGIDALTITSPGAQLEVAAGPESSGTVDGDVPETATTAEQLPEMPPTPVETPAAEPPAEREVAETPSGGVYPAVPPGGTQPVVIRRTPPRYPSSARRAGIEGIVVVRAIIRRDGSVDDVEVLRDLPNGLGDAAADAVENWRFRPAEYQGRPIDVYYTVTINYRLND